jgi:Kef-type K+ transport system membrane component KefB
MKKIGVLLFLFFIALQSNSQTIKPVTKEEYLKKSKNQKTAAWVLLGGGTALVITGASTSINHQRDNPYDQTRNAGDIVAAVGYTAVLVSVPFFTSSSKNKRRAASLSFKNESTPILARQKIVLTKTPSLSLKINL